MSWVEVLGFVTGALSVWLFVRQRVAAWPIGIANSAMWLVLFWQAKLYLDSGLQAIYIVLGAVGWYWWIHGRRTADLDLPVRRTSRREGVRLTVVALGATAVLAYAQARWTDGSLPGWDAATTVVSLLAQYMLTRKLVENWWCWIAVDIAYVGMYASEQLYLTAALQPLFIVLCLRGWRDWRASMTTAGRPSAEAAIP